MATSGRPRAPVPMDFSNRRMTLNDQLNNLKQLDDDEQWAVIERIERETKDYKGFRYHAPATQSRQDHHYNMYRDWMLWKISKTDPEFPEEPTADEVSQLLFPSNSIPEMCDNFRQFLIFVYQHTQPRSRSTGQRISYRTLAQYRDSLSFWARRTFHLRDEAVPAHSTLWHSMTEAMRAVVQYYPNEKMRGRAKAYLGLPELRELFDDGMLHNKSIEWEEQHWAAWCIARATACRPGSICVSSKYTQNKPLTWRDIIITLGDQPGKFNMEIHFQNINIKKPVDPERTIRQKEPRDYLPVSLECPQPGNLIFSTAHRLLVIALRRGILADISTLDELLSYSRQNIRFKEEHLDQPLFFKGRPKGDGIDDSAALTVSTLGEYLKIRARRLGWSFEVLGLNPLRRRALTDLVARVGTETARRVAAHAPDSYTLEKFYLFVEPIFEQTSVMLDQELENPRGLSQRLRGNWAPLAMGKIDDERVKRTRGAALSAMIDRMVLADDNPPPDAATNPEVRRQYRKRLARIAHTALHEHEKQESERTMTKEEYQQRQQTLHASQFADSVMRRALEINASTQDAQDDPESEYEPWEGFEEDMKGADDEEPENDLEETGADSVFIPAEQEMEDEADPSNPGATVKELPYIDMARAFMETLLDNSLNLSKTWAEREKTCPLCADDETVAPDRKDFEYANEGHLENHMNSNFHNALNKFKREAEMRAKEDADGLYVCIYCELAAHDLPQHFNKLGVPIPEPAFDTIKELIEHIRESNENTYGKVHDQFKEQGGWYEAGFFPQASEATKIQARQRSFKHLKQQGIKVVQQRELPRPEPFPGRQDVVRGSHDGIPSRLVNSLNSYPASEQVPVPKKFQGRVSVGPPQSTPMPSFFRDSLVSGNAVPSSSRIHHPRGIVASPTVAAAGLDAPMDAQASRTRVHFEAPAQPKPVAKPTGGSLEEPINISSQEEESSEPNEDDGDAMDTTE